MTRAIEHEATAWASHAEALAAFAFETLPNRHDVWGGYLPLHEREAWGKVTTCPPKRRRGMDTLTAGVLAQHFRGADVGHVIGLHTTSAEQTSRWAALDFDVHEQDGAPVPSEHRARVDAAVTWCTDVIGERCTVLLEDSDGDGGRHLWMRFDAPVATPALYVWLVSVAAACENATGYAPECFPKQARLPQRADGTPQYGNWLRLPGRHHSRAHWSRLAMAGGEWCAGDAAATLLLTWPATPADAIPPLDAWPVPATKAPLALPYRVPRESAPTDRARRIWRYVEKLPHGIAGTGRSNHLYRLAAFLMHDMQCTTAEALPVLDAWNAGNCPPLPDAKVRVTWANAATYGRGGRRAA